MCFENKYIHIWQKWKLKNTSKFLGNLEETFHMYLQQLVSHERRTVLCLTNRMYTV